MFNNRNRLLQQQQQQHLELQRRMAKAERVRSLWVDFEQWLKQPRTKMERERDQLTHQTGHVTSAAVKASRRRIEEAHFLKAREEWQRRLRASELRESDWDPMNESEMKAVEEALGVDDEEGYITDPSPSPPHQLLHPAVASSSLVPLDLLANKSATPLINSGNSTFAQPTSVPVTAPPITASSRTSSTSSYECVRPEEFHSEDEELTPDSDYSSFSSTISTIISEEDEAVGPVTEYMFSQALESSGFTGRPLDTLNDQGLALTRTLPESKLTENGSSGGPPLNPPKKLSDTKPTQHPVTKANHTRAHNTPSPQTLTPSTPSSSKTTKPARVHYPLVAPSLTDLSDYDEIENDSETEPKRLSPSLVAQFEAQFEARKLEIRMDKIREFHEFACEADIALCINVANGRRAKTLTRQEESKLVEEHYQRTVDLRERMEKERKEQVRQEQRRLRDEFSRRNSSSTSRFGQHPSRQGRIPAKSPESDTEPEDDMQHKFERMKQEQLAMQAKYASYEPVESHMARRRAGTLTSDDAPPTVRGPAAANGRLDETGHGSTPKPSGSAWSIKSTGPTNRGLANIVNQNAPLPKRTPSVFDQTAEQMSAYDVDSVDREADNEDDDQEKENAAIWSYLATGPKKKAPPVPSAPSPWNFSGAQKPPQKAVNGRSRLGIVTSAWDDDNFAEETNPIGDSADPTGKDDVEKEVESPQEKTPVIPSAPAPNVPANKKQTKKQRQANKKAVVTTKTEKAEPTNSPPTQKAQNQAPPVQSVPKTQSKSVPVNVPGKSGVGKKGSLVADSDDLSSTPRPSVLKRLQAQLANEEAMNDQDDETPTTPRPAVAKKSMQTNNPWARGFTKGAPSALSNSSFDDDVADLVDIDSGATSSRMVLDQTNGKKNGGGAVHDVPSQVPGSWKWGSVQSDKTRSQVDPPPATTSTRKNAAGRQPANFVPSATLNNGIEPDSGKKKGKKAVSGSGGQRSARGKRTTVEVEEVPDDDGEDLMSGSQSESLPYNSRSILEARDAPEVEQPRILEPKPSKPRTMFENIFQYGETAPDHETVDDLCEGLDWSEERLASAMARMVQDSAEMERRVNGRGAVPTSNVSVSMNGAGPAKAMPMSKPTGEQQSVPKKVRWQPGTLGGLETASPPQAAFANANKMMSRSYDDEAFSPLGTNNNGFSGGAFHFGSYGTGTNGVSAGWLPSSNPYSLMGNHSFSGAEEDDDELARTTRNLLENIHVSVSSQQRNRPGFAAA